MKLQIINWFQASFTDSPNKQLTNQPRPWAKVLSSILLPIIFDAISQLHSTCPFSDCDIKPDLPHAATKRKYNTNFKEYYFQIFLREHKLILNLGNVKTCLVCLRLCFLLCVFSCFPRMLHERIIQTMICWWSVFLTGGRVELVSGPLHILTL